MPLKVRLALVGILQTVAIVAALLVSVYWNERRLLVERAAEERSASLGQLAGVCTATLDAKEERILLSYLRSFIERGDVLDVALWDREGELQIHSDFLRKDYSGIGRKLAPDLARAAAAASGPLTYELPADGRRVSRVLVPVHSGGKRFGTVEVDYDAARAEAELEGALARSRRHLLIIGFMGCLLAALVALAVAEGIVRPVEALSAAAREIGEGRFPVIDVARKDELGRLAGDLGRMAVRLRQLDEFKDHFMRTISHNMRSPLAAVESAAYHARHYVESASPKVSEDFRIIERGVKELTSFINNLLDLERIKAGKMTFRFAPVEVRGLLEQSCDLYQRFAEEKSVRLSVAEAGALKPVPLDQNLVGQAISNLVVNAVKFTPPGGQIELAAAESDGGTVVSVSDTGPGIAPDKLPHVFEKFRQLGTPGADVRGSGLGLALCKEVVEAHGGRIWVENRARGGARFAFWLPHERPGA